MTLIYIRVKARYTVTGDTRSSQECSERSELSRPQIPEQLDVVETFVKGRDVFAVLPNGFWEESVFCLFAHCFRQSFCYCRRKIHGSGSYAPDSDHERSSDCILLVRTSISPAKWLTLYTFLYLDSNFKLLLSVDLLVKSLPQPTQYTLSHFATAGIDIRPYIYAACTQAATALVSVYYFPSTRNKIIHCTLCILRDVSHSRGTEPVRGLVQTIFAENNVILTLCFPPHNVTCLPLARKRCPVSSLETSSVLTPHPLNVILTLFYKNSLDTPPYRLATRPSLALRARGCGSARLHTNDYGLPTEAL